MKFSKLIQFSVVSSILAMQTASAAYLELVDKDSGKAIAYGKITMVHSLGDSIDVTVQANGKNKSFVGLECTIPAAAAAKEMGLSIKDIFLVLANAVSTDRDRAGGGSLSLVCKGDKGHGTISDSYKWIYYDATSISLGVATDYDKNPPATVQDTSGVHNDEAGLTSSGSAK